MRGPVEISDEAVQARLREARLARLATLDADRLNAEVQRGSQVRGLAADDLVERPPVEQFHGDKLAPALLADVVDGADVGVIQRDAAWASR